MACKVVVKKLTKSYLIHIPHVQIHICMTWKLWILGYFANLGDGKPMKQLYLISYIFSNHIKLFTWEHHKWQRFSEIGGEHSLYIQTECELFSVFLALSKSYSVQLRPGEIKLYGKECTTCFIARQEVTSEKYICISKWNLFFSSLHPKKFS